MNQHQKIIDGFYRVIDIMSARDLKGGIVPLDVGENLEVIDISSNYVKFRAESRMDELIINDIESFLACTKLIASKESREEKIKTGADIANKVNIGFYYHLEKYINTSTNIDNSAVGAIVNFWVHDGYREFLVDQFTSLSDAQTKNRNK